jgi:hypothetical protein
MTDTRTSGSDLWSIASADVEHETEERLFTALRIEASQFWPVIASAESKADFNTRMSVLEDSLNAATVAVLDEDTEGHFASLRTRLASAFEQDFDLVQTRRTAQRQAHFASLQREVIAELTEEQEKEQERLRKGIEGPKDFANASLHVADGAYGDTAPYKEDWDRVQKSIEEKADGCQYCKGARTRSGDPNHMCSSHRSEMRNSYATHPASENYWTSKLHTADGPTTTDPNFLDGPAANQSGPTSSEGTPGSSAPDIASGINPTLDHSEGPNILPEEDVANSVTGLREFVTAASRLDFKRANVGDVGTYHDDGAGWAQFDGKQVLVTNESDDGRVAIVLTNENGSPIDPQMGTGIWVNPGTIASKVSSDIPEWDEIMNDPTVQATWARIRQITSDYISAQRGEDSMDGISSSDVNHTFYDVAKMFKGKSIGNWVPDAVNYMVQTIEDNDPYHQKYSRKTAVGDPKSDKKASVIAWTANGSDITPLAGEIMDAADGSISDAEAVVPFIDKVTGKDIACLTDYNYHTPVAEILKHRPELTKFSGLIEV